jgi:hypothetical protein
MDTKKDQVLHGYIALEFGFRREPDWVFHLQIDQGKDIFVSGPYAAWSDALTACQEKAKTLLATEYPNTKFDDISKLEEPDKATAAFWNLVDAVSSSGHAPSINWLHAFGKFSHYL